MGISQIVDESGCRGWTMVLTRMLTLYVELSVSFSLDADPRFGSTPSSQNQPALWHGTEVYFFWSSVPIAAD